MAAQRRGTLSVGVLSMRRNISNKEQTAADWPWLERVRGSCGLIFRLSAVAMEQRLSFNDRRQIHDQLEDDPPASRHVDSFT